ncbi:hypothetical protein XM38_037340 [Halomicronema hongdechloris C2206]|uniref:Caspase domain-containing protein n=1 Tax=Halomicronema hongdechloris C2206 TaxID=1641165 RepID=A0A1Z3HR66_9CYAN|nr:caspase family protein [Halomicronema hongdechloris]ASC72775.1 hypothetical protein XM38_037340 [Halomicronema hongdechloris C2206]
MMSRRRYWYVWSLVLLASCSLAVSHAISEPSLSDRLGSDSDGSDAALATAATQFLVVAGGGAPAYNEIALEKNVHYFQRTLRALGWAPDQASIFFANGLTGAATVRYVDFWGRERFKVPQIPHLRGAATRSHLMQWLTAAGNESSADDCPIFFYFTGHGALNEANPDNNALILWHEQLVSVQQLANQLDQLPPEQPFVTMMAQCYSGSFANLIYENGDPTQPVSPQSRCGFFATVSTRPSVGCTPEVNEADYEDYSSSFFAGLSGRDRIGKSVASADYNDDGRVSFAEAHAFSKIDAETTDWPISTVEAWLQRQATAADRREIFDLPLRDLLAVAPPARRVVLRRLAEKLGLSLQQSYRVNRSQMSNHDLNQAYHHRLRMEVLTIGMEQRLRTRGDAEAMAVLEQLLACEASSWR